ncbi:hypothetical protein EPO15_02330 [bacterium]|nr:MAG: hypothetical protein EPO15_02330 [bacterium]
MRVLVAALLLAPSAALAQTEAAEVLRARRGLMEVVRFQDARADLFPRAEPKEPRVMTRADKEEVWRAWGRFSDHFLALESRRATRKTFADAARDAAGFHAAYAAFLAQYRWALEFVERAEKDPSLHKVLDEPVPELGLPGGAYARFKFRFLNVALGAEFAAFEALRKTRGAATDPDLGAALTEDAAAVWAAGAGKGEVMTLKNGLKLVGGAAKGAWMPVQEGVAEWMGDTKVNRVGKTLIPPEAAGALAPRLLPGDVLIERREWFLSNVGLPGYWPHAALYVGTPEERTKAFGPQFEARLRERYPKAYADAVAPQEHGHAPRVLEAMSEGVVFTTLEHSAGADAVAALRPRLDAREKAEAVLRAFAYAGRPYDYDFDFRTDAAIVCSELVYKAYEPDASRKGFRLPIVTVLGRPVSQPNDFARQFDAEFGTPYQQADLVLFLDGHEREGTFVEEGVEAFRRSWLRPKWHIFVQGAAEPTR